MNDIGIGHDACEYSPDWPLKTTCADCHKFIERKSRSAPQSGRAEALRLLREAVCFLEYWPTSVETQGLFAAHVQDYLQRALQEVKQSSQWLREGERPDVPTS